MGNRVSISFRKGAQESIALFDHWGGMNRVRHAKAYVAKLKAEKAGDQTTPLDRLEPTTVMVDYIRLITKDLPEVDGNLYVGQMRDPMWGDNSDNGHHVINLD